MTSKDLSIFNSLRPFSIGFDDMFDQFESMLGNGSLAVQSNYPPYNIRRAGKDKYAIEVAVAGFCKDDVEVEYEDNLLTVKTKEVKRSEEKEGDEVIHRGISLPLNQPFRVFLQLLLVLILRVPFYQRLVRLLGSKHLHRRQKMQQTMMLMSLISFFARETKHHRRVLRLSH